MKRGWLIGLTVLTLASLAPLVGLVLAGSIANALGCQLVDEGSVHPCPVAGLDIGAALYAGGVLGWLMLVTWPGLLVALCGWTWVIVRAVTRRLRD